MPKYQFRFDEMTLADSVELLMAAAMSQDEDGPTAAAGSARFICIIARFSVVPLFNIPLIDFPRFASDFADQHAELMDIGAIEAEWNKLVERKKDGEE